MGFIRPLCGINTAFTGTNHNASVKKVISSGDCMIKQIQALDTRTFLSLLDTPFHTPLTKLALIVSFTADGWLYFVLLPIIVVTKDFDTRYWLTLAIMAFAAERTIYYVLKNTFRRRRPPAALE